MIDKATIQKINDTADIVDVVSDYVHLIRRGQNYMGLCPFHNERTPSFSVNKRRNFCYCFSCHKGGSPVNFIMEKEGISYYDAMRQLASKYGIKIEEKELTEEERRKISRRESMLTANEWAMKAWQHALTETEEGRSVGLAYFRYRGVSNEAIEAFRLGYSPEKEKYLINRAKKDAQDIDILKQLGIVGTSNAGNDYDRYYGRVIFPIFNTSGKTIAFGGRLLKDGMAKYINSPETAVYTKSNELYGLYQAKNAITREDHCFLVEGYMDVIGMWQAGMKNVVSSSGTALTDGQIALIHRFTQNVTLIYDGDAAGIKASLRGIDMLLSHKLKVSVLLLPDGDDPDSFAAKHTPEEFKAFVDEHATDIIRFKVKILLNESGNDPGKRREAVHSIIDSLACIPDNIERTIYVQECSKLLNMDEQLILTETAKRRREKIVQLRKQKEKSVLERKLASPSSPHEGDSITASSTSPAQTPVKTPQKVNPLEPLEREVLRYAIRYGMLDLKTDSDDDSQGFIPVVQYIHNELSNDNIEFSVDLYSRTFRMIQDMIDIYQSDYLEYAAQIQPQLEEMRKAGYEEIAGKNLDMNAIAKEEDELTMRITDEQMRLLTEYAIDYPARRFLNDEDDDLRRMTTELMAEKYHLSNYHYRMGKVETEFDRLFDLVPRAVLELKDGILNKDLAELISKMRTAMENNDLAEITHLQKEIKNLSELRKELSLQIGERILSPVRRK